MSAAPPMRPRVHVAAAVAVIVLLAAAIATTAEARHQHQDHAHPHHDHHNRDYHTRSHGDRHPGGRVVVTRDADSLQAGAPRHPGMAKDGRLRRDATSAAAVTAVIARDINQALMPVEGKLIRLAKLDRSQQEWRRGLEALSAHEKGQLQEGSAPRGDARSHTHTSPTPHSHARAPERAHEQRQSRCDHGAMSAHTCGDDHSHRDHHDAHPQAGTVHRRDQGSDAATEHADADNTRFRSAMLHDLVNTVRAMQHRHNELQDDVNALARELHSRASSRDEWRELRHHINMVDEQVDRRLTSTGDRVEGELRRMRDYMEVLESRCTRADARSDDAFTPRFDRARGTTDGARGLDSGDGDGGGSEPWYHDVVEGSVWLALFLIGVCVIFNTLATAVMVATKGVWSLVVGSVHVWYWLVRAWRLLRRVRVRCALTRVPRTRGDGEGAAAGAAGGADGSHPASSDHDDDNDPGDDGKADKPKDGCDKESDKTDTSDATGATTTTTTTAAAATNSTPATTAAASADASSGESDSSVLGSFQLRFSFGFAPEESTASGAAAAADTVAEAAADGAGGDDDADDAGSTGTASKSEKQEAAAATETASTAAPSATTATAAASATAATVTGGGDACERTADADTDAYNDNESEEAGAGSDDTAADASA